MVGAAGPQSESAGILSGATHSEKLSRTSLSFCRWDVPNLPCVEFYSSIIKVYVSVRGCVSVSVQGARLYVCVYV